MAILIGQQSGSLDEPAADSGHLPLILQNSLIRYPEIINANHDKKWFGLRPVKQLSVNPAEVSQKLLDSARFVLG